MTKFSSLEGKGYGSEGRAQALDVIPSIHPGTHIHKPYPVLVPRHQCVCSMVTLGLTASEHVPVCLAAVVGSPTPLSRRNFSQPRLCLLQENYYKPPAQEACLPCDCFPHGSHSRACDMDTGQCACKPGVIGRQCNRCDNPFAEVTSLGCEGLLLVVP